jgi:hypothetical protein
MENTSTTLIPQRSRNAVALDRDTLFRMTKSYAREANFCLCGDHSVGFAQSVETILGRSTSRWEDCYAKSGGIGVAVNLLLRSKHRICATPTDGPPKSRIRARELGRSSRESPRFATLNLTLVSISDRSTALRTRQGSAGRWWPDVESEKKFEVEPLYKSGSVAELVQPTAQFNALSDTVPGLNLLDCTPAKPHRKSCVGLFGEEISLTHIEISRPAPVVLQVTLQCTSCAVQVQMPLWEVIVPFKTLKIA